MKYITALLIKFVMITVVLWLILGLLFGVSFANILMTSAIITGVAFVIGDLFILRLSDNVWATAADFVLTFVGVWILCSRLFEQLLSVGAAALISAVGVGIGEFLFHWYLKRRVLKNVTLISERNLETEFGADVDLKKARRKGK